MRRTVAKPMPLPSNCDGECMRWKGANSLSAWAMSKPAPLSLTQKTGAPSASACPSKLMHVTACPALNFQALPSKFSISCRSNRWSPVVRRPGSICACRTRDGSRSLSDASTSAAIALRSTGSRRSGSRANLANDSKASINSPICTTPARMRCKKCRLLPICESGRPSIDISIKLAKPSTALKGVRRSCDTE